MLRSKSLHFYLVSLLYFNPLLLRVKRSPFCEHRWSLTSTFIPNALHKLSMVCGTRLVFSLCPDLSYKLLTSTDVCLAFLGAWDYYTEVLYSTAVSTTGLVPYLFGKKENIFLKKIIFQRILISLIFSKVAKQGLIVLCWVEC